MRFRAVYLLAVAASAVVALTFAGSAAAAYDPACGTTLIANFTLTADISCTGYGAAALNVGQAGITINLNGHTITGDTGQDVIQNTGGPNQGYTGLTVTGGTLVVGAGGTGIDNATGGDSLTVSNMTITTAGGTTPPIGAYGVYVDGTSGSVVSGAMVTGSTFSYIDEPVYLEYTAGAVVKGNTITVQSSNYGVEDYYSTSDVISGNTITGTAQSGTGIQTDETAGLMVSGNTVTGLYDGIEDDSYSAGMMITGNVFGGATPGSGNNYGIELYDNANAVISDNYVRNSQDNGVYDDASQNSSYTGNIVTSSGLGVTTTTGTAPNTVTTFDGGSDAAGFYLYPDEYGPVTMVNNYSRLSTGYGYYIYDAYLYEGNAPTGPYSMFTGNAATSNQGTGFYVEYDQSATWKDNTAYGNGGGAANWTTAGTTAESGGFYFDEPSQDTISNNSATLNAMEGFYFDDAYAGVAPLAVSNNSATLNGDFGFYADTYPVAGSGNTTGGTNASGACYLVSGCS